MTTELDDSVEELVRRSSLTGEPLSPRHFETGSLLIRAAVEKMRVVVDDDDPPTPQVNESRFHSPTHSALL
mgnify:CR=1 FL=1